MPVEDAPSGRERRQARRASTIENFRDWYENEGGQDVMDRIQGLDFGEGQVFDRQIGPGRLSVNLPTEYGDPKVGSIADFLRDPQAWGDQAEQDQWTGRLERRIPYLLVGVVQKAGWWKPAKPLLMPVAVETLSLFMLLRMSCRA